MKKQGLNSITIVIRISFLAALLITAACKERSVSAQTNSSSKTFVKPPKVDIHTAVVTGNLEALKQHIVAGSNLNQKDPIGGSSPLISACLFGQTEIAKSLIDAGADLNFRNNDGSSALLTASFFCRTEIVKMLLAKGADKTIKNRYGNTAYETVAGPFANVKKTYEMLGKMLEPMGLKLDYAYIEKTRPQIAMMLK